MVSPVNFKQSKVCDLSQKEHSRTPLIVSCFNIKTKEGEDVTNVEDQKRNNREETHSKE